MRGKNQAPPHTWPFHAFLSVPLDTEQVEKIGAREGWRAKTFGRGMQGHKPFFHVIEFWLENRLMIEVAPPPMVQEYQDFLKSIQPATMSDPESPSSVVMPSTRKSGPIFASAGMGVVGLPVITCGNLA